VKLEFGPEPSARGEASIFDLVNAVNVILKRFNAPKDTRDIFEDKWSVSEKLEHLMRAISERPRLRFWELFVGVTSRSEVVVTFLALLELIRLKQLMAVQGEAFGEIDICRAEPAAAPAARPRLRKAHLRSPPPAPIIHSQMESV